MFAVPYALARPFLFGLDPEAAHDLTLAAAVRTRDRGMVRVGTFAVAIQAFHLALEFDFLGNAGDDVL